jgi:hypothetical protein
VVEERILLLDVEIRTQGAHMRSIVFLDFLTQSVGIPHAEPVHQGLNPKRYCCAHPYADNLWKFPEQAGRSPAPDQDIVLLNQF